MQCSTGDLVTRRSCEWTAQPVENSRVWQIVRSRAVGARKATLVIRRCQQRLLRVISLLFCVCTQPLGLEAWEGGGCGRKVDITWGAARLCFIPLPLGLLFVLFVQVGCACITILRILARDGKMKFPNPTARNLEMALVQN